MIAVRRIKCNTGKITLFISFTSLGEKDYFALTDPLNQDDECFFLYHKYV